MKSEKLLRRVTQAYREYEFHTVFHSIHNFCTVDISNIYFDVQKDNLYCSHPDEQQRRAAQTVMYKVINDLVVMLTPILAFTTEEIWSFLRREGQPESVQLLSWPCLLYTSDNPVDSVNYYLWNYRRAPITKGSDLCRRCS